MATLEGYPDPGPDNEAFWSEVGKWCGGARAGGTGDSFNNNRLLAASLCLQGLIPDRIATKQDLVDNDEAVDEIDIEVAYKDTPEEYQSIQAAYSDREILDFLERISEFQVESEEFLQSKEEKFQQIEDTISLELNEKINYH